MSSTISPELLKQLGSVALGLLQKHGGDSPLVQQLASTASQLLGQDGGAELAPDKTKLDNAIASMHAAGRRARDALKPW